MTNFEIASHALERLGSNPITSFTDATQPHAARIGRFLAFYSDELLQLHPWPWTLKQAELTDLEDAAWVALTAYAVGAMVTNGDRLYECITLGTSAASGGPTTAADDITDGTVHWRFIRDIEENNTDYEYRYILPLDCLRVKALNNGEDYQLIARLIYTNAIALTTTATGPVLKYIWKNYDYDLWDHLMVDALALRVAAAIAPILTGKPRSDLMEEFSAIIQAAVSKQAAEGTERPADNGWWTDAG